MLGLVEVVGGEEDGLAQGGEPLDQLPRLAAGGRIEPGGGLVQKDQIGVADQTQSKIETAALAARQGLDAGIRLLLQPTREINSSGRAAAGIGCPVQFEGLPNGQHEFGTGLLQHDADPVAECPSTRGGVVAEDFDLALVSPAVPLQDLDRGGFPAPFGPSSASTSPSSTVKLTPATAVTSP